VSPIISEKRAGGLLSSPIPHTSSPAGTPTATYQIHRDIAREDGGDEEEEAEAAAATEAEADDDDASPPPWAACCCCCSTWDALSFRAARSWALSSRLRVRCSEEEGVDADVVAFRTEDKQDD
jgi:hypothetical protein